MKPAISVRLRAVTLLLAVAMTSAVSIAQAESVLRVAMTASDIPDWAGQSDQGAEGYRFVGNSLYDGLINWDLSRSDVEASLTPAPRDPMVGRPQQSSTLGFRASPRRKIP